MVDRRGEYRISVGRDLSERDHLDDPGVNGRLIFKWIFTAWNSGTSSRLTWLRIRTGGVFLWMG